MTGMRISGLASGIDTESMVEKLMTAERVPLNKLTGQKQTLEWQRDQYREVNTSLNELSNYTFDNMILSSTFNKKRVTSSEEGKVTATAINASQNISTQIEVKQLATSSRFKSSGFTSSPAAQKLKFTVKDPGSTEAREVSFSIKAGATADDVVKAINSSGLGVRAMNEQILDTTSGQYVETLVFINNKTGTGGEIRATDSSTSSYMSDNLGFQLNGTVLQKSEKGKDATVVIDGFEIQKTTNTFEMNGMKYTLTGVTNTPVTISTSTDVVGIFDKIKEFVTKYNETITKINEKVGETRYRDYAPLTSDQKKEMSDKEVELWEEKAKSGLLRSDSTLSSTLNSMRSDFYTSLQGGSFGIDHLSDIGITTTKQYRLGGILEIDEAKLKKQIEENPQAISELFSKNGDTYDTQGIAVRLRNTIKDTITTIEKRAGNTGQSDTQYTIGKSLNDLDERINNFNDRLKMIEDRYWSQFTAMEQAIQKANSQSSYLSQYFMQ
ncbi:flagellar hook-associated protein 2 [Priestia endophytica]|uniref:flagellar hook-associated protein 2 n=1 Tax=Priestia endophytica TaxID=135735 RepID=UPI002E22707A|nr:flagellar hook-associated protein 2 [Priestia endophytica]